MGAEPQQYDRLWSWLHENVTVLSNSRQGWRGAAGIDCSEQIFRRIASVDA